MEWKIEEVKNDYIEEKVDGDEKMNEVQTNKQPNITLLLNIDAEVIFYHRRSHIPSHTFKLILYTKATLSSFVILLFFLT